MHIISIIKYLELSIKRLVIFLHSYLLSNHLLQIFMLSSFRRSLVSKPIIRIMRSGKLLLILATWTHKRSQYTLKSTNSCLNNTAFALCLKELYEENVDAGDYLFLNFNEKAFNNLQLTVFFFN